MAPRVVCLLADTSLDYNTDTNLVGVRTVVVDGVKSIRRPLSQRPRQRTTRDLGVTMKVWIANSIRDSGSPHCKFMSVVGKPTSLHKSALPGKQLQDRGLKEIGGNSCKRWSVWFNSTVHV